VFRVFQQLATFHRIHKLGFIFTKIHINIFSEIIWLSIKPNFVSYCYCSTNISIAETSTTDIEWTFFDSVFAFYLNIIYFMYILPVYGLPFGLVVAVADVVFTVSSTSGGEELVVVFEVVVTVSEKVIAIIDKCWRKPKG